MIPKIIHYCWFGNKSLPRYAKKNIESWRRFFPDYEIKEWNEGNFDVNMIPYTESAYRNNKFAFVSDYARYWILYNFGGIYFDTDVEVIRPFNDIIKRGPFLGIEKDRDLISVNPGLGMGANRNMDFYKRIIDFYRRLIVDENNAVLPYLVNETTRFLVEKGFVDEDKEQIVDGITIYPNDFFNPLNDYDGRLNITENTHSIHYYAKSWIKGYTPLRNFLTRKYHNLHLKYRKF